jgi:branched-chain amino acid aminotransferase
MMPCLIRILTPDGLHPADYTADSLAEAAHHEPRDGVYTVTNTFNTYGVLKLSAHLDRMEDSARRAGIPLQLDRARLRQALREVITESGFGDVRFRITVPSEQPDTFILSAEPFRPLDPAVYAQGIRVVTIPNSARQNAEAKTSGWMHDREQIERNLPEGIFTGLLLDEHRRILEGTSSNFYAIRDGRLYTAREGVLPGIAQQIVLEIAPGIVEVIREPVTAEDIPRLDEAFITSSSRGIVPVVEIDGHAIGDGKPGSITRQLREAYRAWVDEHLETL